MSFAADRQAHAKSRPTNCVIQSRIDRRTVATILRYFQGKGLMFHSQAKLIRYALEEFRLWLLTNDAVEDVDTVTEATDMFDAFGIGGFNPGGRSERKLMEEIAGEDNSRIPEDLKKENIAAAFKRLQNSGAIDAIRRDAEKEDK